MGPGQKNENAGGCSQPGVFRPRWRARGVSQSKSYQGLTTVAMIVVALAAVFTVIWQFPDQVGTAALAVVQWLPAIAYAVLTTLVILLAYGLWRSRRDLAQLREDHEAIVLGKKRLERTEPARPWRVPHGAASAPSAAAARREDCAGRLSRFL